MKPIWIVDDDQSIRWVLEKALARENIPHKSFSNPNDVLNVDLGYSDASRKWLGLATACQIKPS